jgi:ribosome-binding factor A
MWRAGSVALRSINRTSSANSAAVYHLSCIPHNYYSTKRVVRKPRKPILYPPKSGAKSSHYLDEEPPLEGSSMIFSLNESRIFDAISNIEQQISRDHPTLPKNSPNSKVTLHGSVDNMLNKHFGNDHEFETVMKKSEATVQDLSSSKQRNKILQSVKAAQSSWEDFRKDEKLLQHRKLVEQAQSIEEISRKRAQELREQTSSTAELKRNLEREREELYELKSVTRPAPIMTPRDTPAPQPNPNSNSIPRVDISSINSAKAAPKPSATSANRKTETIRELLLGQSQPKSTFDGFDEEEPQQVLTSPKFNISAKQQLLDSLKKKSASDFLTPSHVPADGDSGDDNYAQNQKQDENQSQRLSTQTFEEFIEKNPSLRKKSEEHKKRIQEIRDTAEAVSKKLQSKRESATDTRQSPYSESYFTDHLEDIPPTQIELELSKLKQRQRDIDQYPNDEPQVRKRFSKADPATWDIDSEMDEEEAFPTPKTNESPNTKADIEVLDGTLHVNGVAIPHHLHRQILAEIDGTVEDTRAHRKEKIKITRAEDRLRRILHDQKKKKIHYRYDGGSEFTRRQLAVAELVSRCLSSTLDLPYFRNLHQLGISIEEVQLNRDLSVATIFWQSIDATFDQAFAELEKIKPHIRRLFAQKTSFLKFSPALNFVKREVAEQIEEAQNFDILVTEAQVNLDEGAAAAKKVREQLYLSRQRMSKQDKFERENQSRLSAGGAMVQNILADLDEWNRRADLLHPEVDERVEPVKDSDDDDIDSQADEEDSNEPKKPSIEDRVKEWEKQRREAFFAEEDAYDEDFCTDDDSAGDASAEDDDSQ